MSRMYGTGYRTEEDIDECTRQSHVDKTHILAKSFGVLVAPTSSSGGFSIVPVYKFSGLCRCIEGHWRSKMVVRSWHQQSEVINLPHGGLQYDLVKDVR